METFSAPRGFVENPGYARDRKTVLSVLSPEDIDAPILDVVFGFADLPHCFTLQSCYGHFVWPGRPDPNNFDSLPPDDVGSVRYRIAYIALCVEPNDAGARLRSGLEEICRIDAGYVQFGSPSWFWESYPNSYALQVEPERFAGRDEAVIPHTEALRVERVRNEFFGQLRRLLLAERNGSSVP